MIKIMQFIMPLLLLMALSAPASASSQEEKEICTDAITINGICWRMSMPQMMQELEQRYFTCRPNNFNGFQCSGNSSMVLAIEKQVFFSCEQLNVCDIEFTDLARVMANHAMAEMSYKNTAFGGKFCGMGGMGDTVCVFAWNDGIRAWDNSTRPFFKKNIVMIGRGAIASGGISLN